MTLGTGIPDSTGLLLAITSPAARALLLATGAGIALAVFRVKATSLRLFTWTMVLYAALAMPLLARMLPGLSVPVPSFLHTEAPARTAVVPIRSIISVPLVASENSYREEPHDTAKQSTGQAASAFIPGRPAFSVSWSILAFALYACVALFLLTRLVVGFFFTRRLVRAAGIIQDWRITQKLADLTHANGLSAVPEIAESEIVSVPLSVGVMRSTILLPAGWQEWDDTKVNAVITHEFSHVARRDALTQRLSLLHRAIFWFSPLAWWLDRHLADLAEQASDEAALSSGADRKDYARALLGFFEALHTAPGRVHWQGVAMAKAGQAEKRLERILAWKGTITMNVKKSIALVIIALAIPVVYLTAAARPVGKQTAQTAEVAQSQALVAKATAEAMRASAASQVAAFTYAAQASHLHKSTSSFSHNNSFTYGFDDDQRFVIVRGDSDSYTMSGSGEDVRHVEKLKKQISGAFIWFQSDEKSYIIRDQATVDRALKLWAPQEELGKQQEELGKQQEELGKQQEALGKKMEEVRVEVPDMTAQLDKLRAELKALGSKATMDQIGNLQSEMGELQSRIGEIQSHAGEQQGKLGEEMGALGEKQGKLGEKQGELGEKQGKLAEQASRDMKKLLDEAITKGTAQPEL